MKNIGNRIVKVEKTKFKKNKDNETTKFVKPKHHDKSYYRLLKQEKDYVL